MLKLHCVKPQHVRTYCIQFFLVKVVMDFISFLSNIFQIAWFQMVQCSFLTQMHTIRNLLSIPTFSAY